MRRFQVAVIITVVSILSCIASLIYIDNCKKYYSSFLDDIYTSSYSENKDKCQKSLDNFSKKWEKDEKILMIILPHDDVDEIGFEVQMLKEFLKAEEMPEFRAELKRAAALINHLWEKEKPSLINVI